MSRVVNFEIMMQTFSCLMQKLVTAAILHNQMGGKDVFRGTGRPDMEIMDTLHSRHPGQILQYSCRIDLGRYSCHGEMQRVFQQSPAGEQNDEGNRDRDHRIKNIPAGEQR